MWTYKLFCTFLHRGRSLLWSYGKLDLQLPMQLVPITTDVMSSNLDQGEV
jgi:hypothetical protein